MYSKFLFEMTQINMGEKENSYGFIEQDLDFFIEYQIRNYWENLFDVIGFVLKEKKSLGKKPK